MMSSQTTLSPVKLVVYLSITVVIVLFYFFSRPEAPVIHKDTSLHQDMALDLQDNLHLDNLPERTIGYPLLLILTGSSEQPSRLFYLFQLTLYALSISMLVLLLYKLDIPLFAILIFFIFSWLPPFTEHTVIVLSETATIFCLTVGISLLFLYIKNGNLLLCILSGFLLSYGVLVRPTYLIVIPSTVVILLIAHFIVGFKIGSRQQIALLAASLLLPFLVIIGSYIAYNRANFGFTLDAASGFHLTTKTIRVVERLPDEYAVEREILVKQRDADLLNTSPFQRHMGTQYIWREGNIEELMEATGLSFVELSNRMMEANIELITDEPLEYLRDFGAAMTTFWFPLEWEGSSYLNLLWISIHFIVMSIYFITAALLWLGLFMIYMLSKNRLVIFELLNKKKVTVLLLLILTLIIWQSAIISTALQVGIPRYRLPVELLIYVSIVLQVKLLAFTRSELSITRAQDS